MKEYSKQVSPEAESEEYQEQNRYSRRADNLREKDLDEHYSRPTKRQFTFEEIRQLYEENKSVDNSKGQKD